MFSSVAGCGNPADEPSSQATLPPAANAIDGGLAAINRENLQAHLNFLADDARKGRMSGEPGYDQAAEYVAAQFEALGLEPGGRDGWFQPVPLLTRRIDIESAAVTVHGDLGDGNLEWKKDFVMGGDPVRDETSVRAEVVYAGFGVHAPELGYSDYDDIDVNGKIVAIFGGAPATFPHNQRAF